MYLKIFKFINEILTNCSLKKLSIQFVLVTIPISLSRFSNVSIHQWNINHFGVIVDHNFISLWIVHLLAYTLIRYAASYAALQDVRNSVIFKSGNVVCSRELRPFSLTVQLFGNRYQRYGEEIKLKMLSLVSRSSNLASSTVAATQSIALGTKASFPAVKVVNETTLVPPAKRQLTASSLTAVLPKKPVQASFSTGGKTWVMLLFHFLNNLFWNCYCPLKVPAKFDMPIPTFMSLISLNTVARICAVMTLMPRKVPQNDRDFLTWLLEAELLLEPMPQNQLYLNLSAQWVLLLMF